MSRRSNLTARQVRLGVELKKLRERVGVTARDAAREIGLDQAKMSHLEAGRVAVGEERVRRLTARFGVTDAPLVDALVAMAEERDRGWWEEFRGTLTSTFLDLAELEHHAKRLRTLQVVHIPGLLQTEEYVRAIHTYVRPLPPAGHLEAVVAFRMRRQNILDGESRTPFDAVIHEAALRIRVGDRKVAHRQLEAILQASERPWVRLRVVPFEVDGFAGSGFSMLYADGPVPQLDTVQLDAAHSTFFLDGEEQLGAYRNLFSKVERSALEPTDSRDLIRRVMGDL